MPTLAVAHSSNVPEAVSLRTQGQDFWVICPRRADAKTVRDSLLTQHFGYLPEDIEALVLARKFKIIDTRTPKDEATPKQIATWERDALGRLAVHLSDYWIDVVQKFRIDRVRSFLIQASGSIADPSLRAKWIDMMQKILTDGTADRGNTFIELMNAMNGSGQQRGQFVAAFENLQKTTAGSSPYVDLALANLALEEAKTLYGPGYTEKALEQLETALRKLEATELRNGTLGSLTRADAVVINRQAARIQSELGDEDGANRREWIARWLDMTERERAEYEEGDVIDLIPPNVKLMSAPNKTSRELAELEQDWAKRQQMEGDLNKIGAQTLPNFPNDEKLLNQGTETTTIEGMVLRKKRGTGEGYQPRYRVNTVVVPLRNPTALDKVKGGAGAVDLFNTVGKFIAADRRMRELSEYLAKKERLQRRLYNQRFRSVPPKPAKVKLAIDQFMDLDRRTTDTKTKEQIQTMISYLRALLEESRAAWPGQ